MSKITIPYSAEADSNQETPTQEVNSSFFSTRDPSLPGNSSVPNSGSVINGFLHKANLAEEVQLTSHHFKPGTFSQGASIGTTDNLDFFPDVFPQGNFIARNAPSPLVGGRNQENINFVKQTNFFLPIPGACTTFYNPYKKALAIFTWNISIAIDGHVSENETRPFSIYHSSDPRYATWLIFKLVRPDGVEITEGVRKTETAYRTVLVPTHYRASAARRGAQKDMYYSGHLMYEFSENPGVGTQEGWYSAGLHIGFAAPKNVIVNEFYNFCLESNAMDSAPQEPNYYQYKTEGGITDFTVLGPGTRQARVRVRSLRHLLFKL